MKKIIVLILVIITIFIIYTKTKDNKIYYLVLGDEINLGMTNNNYYKKSYTEYIKDYLEENNKLEIYINNYTKSGNRITDIINDIQNNKETKINNKTQTLKNTLIKTDLLIIAIGTNDIISKIYSGTNLNKSDYKNLETNLSQITKDYENLLKEINNYCKENKYIIGININTSDKEINNIIKKTNNSFKELAKKYKYNYIDLYEIFENNTNYKIYPTEQEHKKLSELIIKNNVLLK